MIKLSKKYIPNEIITVIAGENLSANDYCFVSQGNYGSFEKGKAYKIDTSLGSFISPLRGFNISGIKTTGQLLSLLIGGIVTISGLTLGSFYFIHPSVRGSITDTSPLNNSNDFLIGQCRDTNKLTILDKEDYKNINFNQFKNFTVFNPSQLFYTGGNNGSLSFYNLIDDDTYEVTSASLWRWRKMNSSSTYYETFSYIFGGDVDGAQTPYTGGYHKMEKLLNENTCVMTNLVYYGAVSYTSEMTLGKLGNFSYIFGGCRGDNISSHTGHIAKIFGEDLYSFISAFLRSSDGSEISQVRGVQCFDFPNVSYLVGGEFGTNIEVNKFTNDSTCVCLSNIPSGCSKGFFGHARMGDTKHYTYGGSDNSYWYTPSNYCSKISKFTVPDEIYIVTTIDLAQVTRTAAGGSKSGNCYFAGGDDTAGAGNDGNYIDSIQKLDSSETRTQINATCASTSKMLGVHLS